MWFWKFIGTRLRVFFVWFDSIRSRFHFQICNNNNKSRGRAIWNIKLQRKGNTPPPPSLSSSNQRQQLRPQCTNNCQQFSKGNFEIGWLSFSHAFRAKKISTGRYNAHGQFGGRLIYLRIWINAPKIIEWHNVFGNSPNISVRIIVRMEKSVHANEKKIREIRVIAE